MSKVFNSEDIIFNSGNQVQLTFASKEQNGINGVAWFNGSSNLYKTRTWYKLFRFTDPKVAEIFAKTVKDILSQSSHIGYDEAQKYTLYDKWNDDLNRNIMNMQDDYDTQMESENPPTGLEYCYCDDVRFFSLCLFQTFSIKDGNEYKLWGKLESDVNEYTITQLNRFLMEIVETNDNKIPSLKVINNDSRHKQYFTAESNGKYIRTGDILLSNGSPQQQIIVIATQGAASLELNYTTIDDIITNKDNQIQGNFTDDYFSSIKIVYYNDDKLYPISNLYYKTDTSLINLNNPHWKEGELWIWGLKHESIYPYPDLRTAAIMGGTGNGAYGFCQFHYKYGLVAMLNYVMEKNPGKFEKLRKFTQYGAGNTILRNNSELQETLAEYSGLVLPKGSSKGAYGIGNYVQTDNDTLLQRGKLFLNSQVTFGIEQYLINPVKYAASVRFKHLDNPVILGSLWSMEVASTGARMHIQAAANIDNIEDQIYTLYKQFHQNHPYYASRFDPDYTNQAGILVGGVQYREAIDDCKVKTNHPERFQQVAVVSKKAEWWELY